MLCVRRLLPRSWIVMAKSIAFDTLPMQKPVSLLADEYQVRLSADGRLSQTFTMDLQRGHNLQATTTLDYSYLIPPQTIETHV